ncbi:MAG: hypothetical protein JO362_20290 [Streptomycetaceae bacterium]|nr:hypothetical protein [Streptomycetaceae bacterium]
MTDQSTALPTGAGLIMTTLDLARQVEQGGTRCVESLAAHGRALAYAYTFPAHQGVNGARPDSGDPRVDLMRRVSYDGNGVLAVTAGEIRRTYGTAEAGRVSLAGHNLCTLPAVLPDDDQAPVIVFSGIAPGIGSLLSRVAHDDRAGVEAALEDLFARIVRGVREPHPMDY